MTSLVIDLTPMVINRTAIYHIARDTFCALDPATTAIQYRGQIHDHMIEDREASQTVANAFFNDVGRFAAQHVHVGEFRPDPPVDGDARARLFFDPIYTLYRPLNAQDVVFVLDMSTLTNPEWHEPHVVRVYEQAFRRIAASRAKIVSISHNTTAALRATFAMPSRQIFTVPLYVRGVKQVVAKAPETPLQPNKFLLFVGSLESRKNLVGLIDAFMLTNLHQQGYNLVIAGGDGRGAAEIRSAAEAAEGVHLLGFVTDGELRWLYENAAAFTYPSHLEGFGVPLVEAMSFGLPCLSSTTGAPPEIIQDLCPAVDPSDLMSIVAGLNDVVALAESSGEDLRRRLRDRAAVFTFESYMRELSKALPVGTGALKWKP